jgi:hypothetical protein
MTVVNDGFCRLLRVDIKLLQNDEEFREEER